jgi:hypothetical protein
MLLNLKEDISESKDLAATQPEKLKELQTAFAGWEKITQPAQWTRQDGRTQASPAIKAKREVESMMLSGTPIGTPMASSRARSFLNRPSSKMLTRTTTVLHGGKRSRPIALHDEIVEHRISEVF